MQLSLPLPKPARTTAWGGRRRNAGRKPSSPGRRRAPHVCRVLRHVRRALRNGRRHDFRVVHYSAQGDHLHLLVEADTAASLRSGGDEPAALRPVSLPMTWLLRRGWRKHGLVDLTEVPEPRSRREQRS